MKKVLFLAVLCVFLMQGVAFAESKIGIINTNQVLLASDAGKSVNEKLKVKLRQYRQDMQDRAKQVRALQEKLVKQRAMMNADARDALEKKIRDLRIKLSDLQTKYNKDMQTEEITLKKPVLVLLKKVISDYAKKKGLSVVLERTVGVIYAIEGSDISKPVLAEFNTAWKNKK